jgi:hypothetical protein
MTRRDKPLNQVPDAARPPDDARRLHATIFRLVKADIEALDSELALYERSYGMSSKTFYASYARGTDGRLRSPDFAAWSDLYVARLEREALYRQMLGQREA